VTFFQDSEWRRTRTLAIEQVAYFRRVLVTHANDAATGVCGVCGVAGCADWRSAYDQLAVAGELMAEPEQWLVETGRPQERR
jgi:hypothetical protein